MWLIKDTKAHCYFDAQRYSSPRHIANAMLAAGLLNYFIVGL